MFLDNYCNQENDKISFTRIQASDFAKKIADDFNPLHDTDAKRFCVPGDLLFSLVLANSGLSQEMTFIFSGMVSNDIKLTFPKQIQNLLAPLALRPSAHFVRSRLNQFLATSFE